MTWDGVSSVQQQDVDLGGDHELSENIVHLVLKIPGADGHSSPERRLGHRAEMSAHRRLS
jgi:hypothetical protein